MRNILNFFSRKAQVVKMSGLDAVGKLSGGQNILTLSKCYVDKGFKLDLPTLCNVDAYKVSDGEKEGFLLPNYPGVAACLVLLPNHEGNRFSAILLRHDEFDQYKKELEQTGKLKNFGNDITIEDLKLATKLHGVYMRHMHEQIGIKSAPDSQISSDKLSAPSHFQ